LVEQISARTNLAQLKTLLRLAATAGTLEEFEQAAETL
jgi:hypothetical protein